MVQNLKWATAHLSRRLGAGLGAQVGAGRACVLGVQGERATGRAGRWGAQGERALAELWRAHGRGRSACGQAAARGRRRHGRAVLGVSVRSARRGRPGRAAWACLCAQARHAGWSAGLVLVHSAPGSVLTQSLTGSTRYFS